MPFMTRATVRVYLKRRSSPLRVKDSKILGASDYYNISSATFEVVLSDDRSGVFGASLLHFGCISGAFGSSLVQEEACKN